MRRLLDAGIEVFASRGFHAARVDDIVKAAATSHGTFYLYFANKEDLFAALVADVAEQVRALGEALGPIGPDEEGRRALRAWLAEFTGLYERYGPIIRTWTEAEVGPTAVGRLGTDVLGELAGAFAERARPGRGQRLDPQIAALALVAMIERFNYFVLSGQVDAHRDEMLDILADVVAKVLFPSR
jgi:AcrR family transcriptional regulator